MLEHYGKNESKKAAIACSAGADGTVSGHEDNGRVPRLAAPTCVQDHST